MTDVTDITHKAILLAENNLQSSLLKDAIEQDLALEIELVALDQLLEPVLNLAQSDFDYVIIDYPAMTEKRLERYQDICGLSPEQTQEILINVPDDLAHSEILKWQQLVGIFYVTDTIGTLLSGFKCILVGEMWMSRKLVFEYIKFYRGRQCAKTSPYYSKLTKREQQIIKMLGEGASNTEIAEALFVSENTVKAHLHNTFKKIKVKNRLQALLWAKNNIASSEFI